MKNKIKNLWGNIIVDSQVLIKIKKSILIILMLTLSSCEKFLEIDGPKDSASSEEMFASEASATSAITGIYSRMALSGPFSGDNTSITVLGGLSADEFKSHNTAFDVFYKNDIPTSDGNINRFWANSYSFIYTANAILEGLNLSNGVSQSAKRQIEGEAKFIRAFCYFYLTNFFGEVPLNLTTDYRINLINSKSSKEAIYTQIVSDLIDAENMLGSNYITTERIRPNKWAAKALLSRVYLFTEKWDLAIQKATEIIDQKALYTLVGDVDQIFLKNSSEAIWQMMPTAGTNTKEGAFFILTGTPNNVSLSKDFLADFESGDIRKDKWVGTFTNTTGTYNFPFKYKLRSTVNGVISEYQMVLRLSELYLIRAEGNARINQLDLSVEDINVIRKRAGLLIPLKGLNTNQCLLEVERQRRFELFSEWGHRWLDLKRTNRASPILSALKGASWKDTDTLYPIPDSEINRNSNIIQNSGY